MVRPLLFVGFMRCRWEPMLGVLAVGLLPQLRNEQVGYLCHLVRVLHSTQDYLALVALLLQVSGWGLSLGHLLWLPVSSVLPRRGHAVSVSTRSQAQDVCFQQRLSLPVQHTEGRRLSCHRHRVLTVCC